MINSGAWFVYLVPLAALVVFWKTTRQMFVNLSVVSGDDYPELSAVGDPCAEPV